MVGVGKDDHMALAMLLILLILFSQFSGVTLWLFNIAMENCLFIDDFPIKTTIYFVDSPWLC